MKTAFSALCILFYSVAGGQPKNHILPHFDKIVASPRINLILQAGEQESIGLVYHHIDSALVHAKVTGKKLMIYLEDARTLEKQETFYEDGHRHKQSIYQDASVTAYVTYRELRALEVRGEQEVTCNDPITTDKLKLTLYGESEIDLTSVHARKFKASLYGENKLRIRSGEVDRQVYRLFGENKIDTRGLSSHRASTRIYGEGRIKLNASHTVHINAFGEPEITVAGDARVRKGIVLGRVRIYPQ